jgi:hypothetical protein
MTRAVAKRVWLLNLDAERELAAAGGYDTPKRLREQIAREAQKIQAALCLDEDVLSPAASTTPSSGSPATEKPPESDEPVAIAWCPTPNAQREARRAQLRVPPAPPLDVLRRVNHRRFALEVAASPALTRLYAALPAELGATSSFETARRFITRESSEARDLSWLEHAPEVGHGHRLKRTYGFAGKGQHRITGSLQGDDHKWIREALGAGGFLVEPEITLTGELSLHGLVDEAGILLGEPCQLLCDRFGAPQDIRRTTPDAAPPDVLRALRDAGAALAEALGAAGYFGPFGLDARLFECAQGRGITLIGDVNARFTMGWSIGLGDAREPALERLVARRE